MFDGLVLFDTLVIGILALNVAWFGVAFRFFSLKPEWAAKGLVERADRRSPLIATLAGSMRFLGGINLSLAVFAALLLFERKLFPDPRAWGLFTVVFAVAHASQFHVNVAVLWQGRRTGKLLWPVLSGTMFFIFIVDGILAVANAAVAAAAYLSA